VFLQSDGSSTTSIVFISGSRKKQAGRPDLDMVYFIPCLQEKSRGGG